MLIRIIENEGGRILATGQFKQHMRVEFTFDGHHIFTQTLPRHQSVGDRWEKNFRAAIRRLKPKGK
jgi:hypothetical protein